jgi:hypothetical protein
MSKFPDRRLIFVLTLWLLVTTSACIIIPTPPHGGVGVITEKAVESLKPESSTRADVLHRLGDPAERLEEDRFFVYRWEKTVAYWDAIGPVASNVIKDVHYLLLEFTQNNRLRRLNFVDGGRLMLDKVLDEWQRVP